MTSFNLSDWALRHKSFVALPDAGLGAGRLMAYGRLGREEDPPFTIKTMVVQDAVAGRHRRATRCSRSPTASRRSSRRCPNLDYVRSYTKPGESDVFVNLKDTRRAAKVPDIWYQVRKKVGDIRAHLPSDVSGPSSTTSSATPTRSSTPSPPTASRIASCATSSSWSAAELLRVQDVAKVDFIGAQDEKIYLEFSTQQLAALGHRRRAR